MCTFPVMKFNIIASLLQGESQPTPIAVFSSKWHFGIIYKTRNEELIVDQEVLISYGVHMDAVAVYMEFDTRNHVHVVTFQQ